MRVGVGENREHIYECISKSPGIHLRGIYREVGLSMGNIQHHLLVLQKEGVIKSRKINGNRHYYLTAIPAERDELFLRFLRKDAVKDILTYLIEHPGSTHTDIVNFMHLSASTINWHMSRLIEAGLVITAKNGRMISYYIEDPIYLINSLRTYSPQIWNRLADKFAVLFVRTYLQSQSDNIENKRIFLITPTVRP